MTTLDIKLPHNGWLPRWHQLSLWRYLQAGGKRAVAIWHRRAGKDEICLHHAACAAGKRVANYWHLLPEYNQGRKAIWSSVNAHTGKRRIDEAFPLELRASTNETEMQIKLLNGSTWAVMGSDRYDSLVGSGAAGVTFSEYALSNPSAWAYCRPMLEENNGWATFISTPRGHNHAKAIYEHALRTPGWFAELLSAHDTQALSSEQLDVALSEYVSLHGADVGSAMFAQEYECSFNAAILGAFYSLEMAQVRAEGRILPIEPTPGRPVNTSFDIGVNDDTAIWWWQSSPTGQLLILDHYASSGVGVEHYRDVIVEREAARGWQHGIDYVPHDARVREWIVGKTRVQAMQELGLRPMLAPDASKMDGINAVRRTLPFCVFHPRCEEGITALEQYRREWDDEKKCFRASEVHDWTSDSADSFRYLSLAWKPAPMREIPAPKMDGWRIPPPVDRPVRGRMQL